MRNIKTLLLILSLLFSISILGQSVNKNDLKYKPKNLDEAISQLDLMFHDTTKSKIFEMTEDEFLVNAHMSTGMWIRNNWDLWRGGDLSKFFNDLGIYHPDDMSGIVLKSYYRHLHEKTYELDKQIQFYQDYWKKSQEHEQRMKTDTAYVRQKKIEDQKARLDYYNKLKDPYPPGTKVTGWADYSIGFFSGGRTKVEGEIIMWDDTYAIIRVTDYVDEKKKERVVRYNKMTDNILRISLYQLDIWNN